jgi:low affinity Fe/Cu permease
MALIFILAIVLIVALVGSLPMWPHSRNWGYYPLGGVSVVILIILFVLLSGRMHVH